MLLNKIKNAHKSALYHEIDLPKDTSDVCIELKPILQKELKNRNIVCFTITITLSTLLTAYISSRSDLIDQGSQLIPYFNNSAYTAIMLLILFSVFSKLVKYSSRFGLYAIESRPNERIYLFFAFSRFLSTILSVCCYNLFKFLRFLLLIKGQFRVQYIFVILGSLFLPYVLSSNFKVFTAKEVLEFNISLLEFITIMPISALVVVLGNSILFATAFSTVSYLEKIKTMAQLEKSCTETFDYYIKRSLDSNDPNYTLLVKGFSTAFGSILLAKLLKLILQERIKNKRLNELCIFIAKCLIKARNLIAFFLLHYANILIFISEVVLSLYAIKMFRLTIIEFLRLKSLPDFDLLNFSVYSEFLNLFALLSVSFLISNSVFRSMLYKKKIKTCLKIIKDLETKKIVLLARRESKSSSNIMRRRIGLLRD